MVHFDLPPIKINLQEGMSMAFEFGGKQIGGLAVMQGPAFTNAVRSGRNDQQAQWAAPGTSLPINILHQLVAHTTPFAAIEDFGLLPLDRIVFTDPLRSKFVHVIKTVRSCRGSKTEHGIFSGTGDDVHAR